MTPSSPKIRRPSSPNVRRSPRLARPGRAANAPAPAAAASSGTSSMLTSLATNPYIIEPKMAITDRSSLLQFNRQSSYQSVPMSSNNNNNNASNDDDDSMSLSQMAEDDHRTDVMETFIHLVKGYIGPGCLSLPWAVSQLGIVPGCVALCILAFWSSYNCWIVVKLKRYMESSQQNIDYNNNDKDNDNADAVSEAQSSVTTATNITYPEVGEWAYGKSFQNYVSACVCTQQLAICTVFMSFIGENILAVLERLYPSFPLGTHFGVITLALPFAMSLSFLPDLKALAPVMALGTVFLLLSFINLGIVLGLEWDNRPESPPPFNPPQAPLAACAILYSFEGICLILPVESAMKEPQHFKKVFTWSMVVVSLILATVASSCIFVFGRVTNGSVTAFLLEAYDDPYITWWILGANTLASLSVLMTYPLQLFPALELLAPVLSPKLNWLLGRDVSNNNDDDKDLAGFDPMPPLPEHEAYEHESLDSHDYEAADAAAEENKEDKDDDDRSRNTGFSSVTTFFPQMTMPGDSPLLRALLVFLTYFVAVVVPNVQALISLAGALAGASTALLIPPLLELAWIKHLEKRVKPVAPAVSGGAGGVSFDADNDSPPTPSTGSEKSTSSGADDYNADDDFSYNNQSRWFISSPTNPWGKWWKEKVKCYVLLFIGCIFSAIGTYASLADIVKIYLGVGE